MGWVSGLDTQKRVGVSAGHVEDTEWVGWACRIIESHRNKAGLYNSNRQVRGMGPAQHGTHAAWDPRGMGPEIHTSKVYPLVSIWMIKAAVVSGCMEFAAPRLEPRTLEG